MSEAKRDQNYVPSALGVSSADSVTTLPFKIDSTTGRLLTDAAGGGTVTSVSVVSANGFAGTVATATTTPAITLTTTITGILSGNGTAISAASTTGSGAVVLATAPTFVTSLTTPSVLATANDSGALGASGTAFSDLFLASGGVINWLAGATTITHSANTLTLGGSAFTTLALGTSSLTLTGSLAATGARVTKGWFTDLESTNMPTVGGTAILTSLTAPQFTTIELGAASDTTLSRVSAGVIAVEGVRIITSAGTTSGTILKNNGTTFVASTETYAAPGTSGNVMTSDGTNWTSAAPSGGGLDPTTQSVIYDDFQSGGTSSGTIGDLGWLSADNGNGGSIAQNNGNSDAIGVCAINGPTNAGGAIGIALGSTGAGSGGWGKPNRQATLLFRMNMDATTNCMFYVGIIRAAISDNAGPDQGIYFQLDTSSTANWVGICKDGSGTSTTASSSAPSTSFQTFKIVINAAGTSVEFFVDGVSIGTVTGNIPVNSSVYIGAKVRHNGTAGRVLRLDYAYANAVISR